MQWDLAQLRESVELRFGVQQRRLMGASLDSIITRFTHAEFHIAEFLELERVAVDGRTSLDLVKEIFRFHESRIPEISLKASAHAMAAVQALHSISDIAGTTIVLALCGATEWKGYLREVCAKLSTGRERLEPMIDALRGHEDYEYLDALVNQSKHRNIVTARFTTDVTGGERNRYDFIPFKRGAVDHPAREVKPFMVDEYKRQCRVIYDIGNELNRVAFSQRP